MDILHIIRNSGIQNPHAALYFSMDDGLAIAYTGDYFHRRDNDANKHAFQLFQILAKNQANIVDADGYGFIKYNSFDVFLFLDKKENTVLAVYK